MKKVLVLGGGQIGSVIAYHISRTHPVTLADITGVKNQNLLIEAGVTVRMLNFDDVPSLEVAVLSHDIIINAGPHFTNGQIATASAKFNKVYFDLTEDIASTQETERKFATSQAALAFPQCGLAPGVVSIIAADMAKKFDTVLEVKMRVGALPLYPNNALGYALTWSIDGLLNEYSRQGEAIKHDAFVKTTPLEEVESLVINGVQYEAFNTSGGIGTLHDSMWATTMSYKTIRYPGHAEKMKFLMHDLKIDRQTLLTILRNAIPTTEQDQVVIRVSVNGVTDGVFSESVYDRVITRNTKGVWPAPNGVTAIQATTAQSLVGVFKLYTKGLIPRTTGFVRQEELDLFQFHQSTDIFA